MAVTIRPMRAQEFETFWQWSVENHTKELMEQLCLPEDTAAKEAVAELTEMLPKGLHTEHNYLMTILENMETVGFVWTLHEEFQGRKQSFLCDFVIWQAKRRQGYATAALKLVEETAVEAGCQESVLFVRDDNAAARALYQKCGYQVLRQKDYGKFMVKQIA